MVDQAGDQRASRAILWVPDWRSAQPWDYEPEFSTWMQLLTSEGLHDKADIAQAMAMLSRELAERDAELARLRRGEFICLKCGLRKDGENDPVNF